jgi:hypothetical protein
LDDLEADLALCLTCLTQRLRRQVVQWNGIWGISSMVLHDAYADRLGLRLEALSTFSCLVVTQSSFNGRAGRAGSAKLRPPW